MLPYLILLGLVSVLAMTGARRARPALFGLGLVFFAMIGWRLKVGMDWNNYVLILQMVRGQDLGELLFRPDPTYGLLLWLSNKLNGVTFLNAVSAAIFCTGLFAVARRCAEPLLAIAVATPYLVLVIAMSATRQAMALGIIFLLFAEWYRLKLPIRAGLVLMAASLHISAAVNLIFVILQSNISGLKRVIGAVLFGLLMLALMIYMPDRVSFYRDVYVSGGQVIDSPGALYHVLLIAVPALLYFVLRRRWQEVHGSAELIRQLAIAALLAVPGLLLSSTGADRLSLYFWPIAMYVWSGLPTLAERPQTRIGVRAGIVGGSVALALVWLLFANSAHAHLPYRNSLF